MIFLVVEDSAELRESLCYVLLSLGVKARPVAGRAEALELLRGQKEITGAIVDIDSRESQGLELIRELRESPELRPIKVVVHTVQSSRELVVRMMELGVVGYLLKPYSQKELYEKLKNVLERCQAHNYQRKHIRVKPDPDELLRLHFKLPNVAGLVSGRIVDISVGGAAVELFNSQPEEVLKPGTQIPRIEFTLSRKQFAPPGKVVLYKERLLALRFDFLTVAEKTTLARYVFKRVAV
jgi:two-component system chemotaxis response regulator CheY